MSELHETIARAVRRGLANYLVDQPERITDDILAAVEAAGWRCVPRGRVEELERDKSELEKTLASEHRNIEQLYARIDELDAQRGRDFARLEELERLLAHQQEVAAGYATLHEEAYLRAETAGRVLRDTLELAEARGREGLTAADLRVLAEARALVNRR